LAGKHVPEAWVGQEVFVTVEGRQPVHAKLDEVSPRGLVVRVATSITWGGGSKYSGPAQSDTRPVPTFYPWHRIDSIRLAEPEEGREQEDAGREESGPDFGMSGLRRPPHPPM